MKLFLFPFAFLVAYFVFFRFDGVYTNQYEKPVLESVALVNLSPLGELVSGVELTQPINWTLLNLLKEEDLSAPVCVNIFLANYGDRKNHGYFSIELMTAGRTFTGMHSAASVKDNSFQLTCFNDILFSDISKPDGALIIKGVDSPAGQAITAWLTDSVPHGVASLNGKYMEKGLVFEVIALRTSSLKLWVSYILTFIAVASSLVLLVASPSGFSKLAKTRKCIH